MSNRIKSVRAEHPAGARNAHDATPAPPHRPSEPGDGVINSAPVPSRRQSGSADDPTASAPAPSHRALDTAADVTDLSQAKKATPSSNGNHTRAASTNSREINSPLLFSNNPQPMMIYDPETLLFLDVNTAALHQYGYTREDLLSMRHT